MKTEAGRDPVLRVAVAASIGPPVGLSAPVPAVAVVEARSRPETVDLGVGRATAVVEADASVRPSGRVPFTPARALAPSPLAAVTVAPGEVTGRGGETLSGSASAAATGAKDQVARAVKPDFEKVAVRRLLVVGLEWPSWFQVPLAPRERPRPAELLSRLGHESH